MFLKPLTWMVVGELVVVSALVAVSWHMLSTAAARPSAPLLLPLASPSPDDLSPPDVSPGDLSPPDPSALPQLAGLNVDPAFWRSRLAGLNEAEAQVEALEWKIVHSAMDTVQRYLDSVVIPAVRRAERSG